MHCIIVHDYDSDEWKLFLKMVASYQEKPARAGLWGFFVLNNNNKFSTRMNTNEIGFDRWESKDTGKAKLWAGWRGKVARIYKASFPDMHLLSSLTHFKYYGSIFWTVGFLYLVVPAGLLNKKVIKAVKWIKLHWIWWTLQAHFFLFTYKSMEETARVLLRVFY